VSIKIALPKGRLLAGTASLLENSGWGISGYGEGARYYRLKSTRFPHISARLFHEKDIPIQVAMGNYDLGVCGLDWIEELLVKYPSSDLVKIKDLKYGNSSLYMAASKFGSVTTLEGMRSSRSVMRIVGEYPNLAESFAIHSRLKRFNIFPVWGAAEAYPPENAELALVSGSEESLADYNLTPVSKVLAYSAFLIANKTSWENKDLSEVLDSIGEFSFEAESVHVPEKTARLDVITEDLTENTVWLALPDGHQQKHVVGLLNKAGIEVEHYPSRKGKRRPKIHLDGITVKVIRPQDMPLQVANGNFDVAITGRDWLKEHFNAFPSSPVEELLDLKYGWVRIVAVVAESSGITDIDSLKKANTERETPFRVASEYVNIADKFARNYHLGMYRIVPTWGASEAFVPEDADVLIENTETGQTLARHKLRIIDTLFESTACLIAGKGSVSHKVKGKTIKNITEKLRKAVEES